MGLLFNKGIIKDRSSIKESNDVIQLNQMKDHHENKENDDNKITPIIVISSNTDHKHRVEILKTSVEHFIKKPIDEEYLYYTIIN